jgi:MscS family membrane protein
MEILKGFWDQVVQVWSAGVFGVSLGPIVAAVAVILVFVVTRGFFTKVLLGILRRVVKRTATKIDDMFVDALEKPLQFAFLVLGLYFAARLVHGTIAEGDWLDNAIRSLIAFTIFWALYQLVEPFSYLIDRALYQLGTNHIAHETLVGFTLKLLKTIIVALGIAAILQEWGFNVVALLGGLGLVGVAAALGAKDMVANVFGGMMIFLNRLFERGHWIKTSSFEGVVEDVGLIATQVRQFDKALVIVPNSQLTEGPVVNYSMMTNRRIFWNVGVEYRTTSEQLGEIVNRIRDYIHHNEDFETDPARVPTFVVVDEFGDSSINIMLYCFTKTTNWGEWLGVKQALAYEIKEIVEGVGAGFAFPSRSLYVETWPMGTPEPYPLQGQQSSGAAD